MTTVNPSSPKTKHLNDGACAKCHEIINRYPGFHSGLATWFHYLQVEHPEAHVAWAGRGKLEQEMFFMAGTSKAHWGQSAHNYNLALDLFELTQAGASWSRNWFNDVVYPAVTRQSGDFSIEWYGMKGSPYFELPHVQVKGWKTLGWELVEK